MKIFKSIAMLALGASIVGPASAQEKQDKIGTVNMQKLVSEYYKTAETQKSFKIYNDEINAQSKPRVETLNAVVEEFKKLQKQAEDPTLNRDKKNELFQELTRKQNEVQGLDRELKAWADRKRAALSEKAEIVFGEVRKEVLKEVQTYGAAEGYDFIFDRSGGSGAGVPILSYTKDATDLTGALLELLNKDAPEAGEEKVEKEEPAPEPDPAPKPE